MGKQFNFVEKNWFTPNTYNTNYKDVPEASGVYLIAKPIYVNDRISNWEIVYVGKSKNMKNRYKGHKTLDKIKSIEGYVRFYFREYSHIDILEKKLIKSIQPRYNVQCR